MSEKLLKGYVFCKAKLTEKRGSFGIKGIAITVATIVIIGVVTGIVTGQADSWVNTIWNKMISLIDDSIKK